MSDQRMQWCRTESMAAAFDCIAKGHDVAEFRTGGIVNGPVRMPSSGCVIDPDPSTEQWREAMGRSTSAKLRAAEAELGAALSALTRSNAEIERLRGLLKDAYDANLQLISERTEPTQEQPHG